jgi:hypothetical protein
MNSVAVCLTQVLRYAILFAHQYRAASSMAEHPTLNRQVQGSTPWQTIFPLFLHHKVLISIPHLAFPLHIT